MKSFYVIAYDISDDKKRTETSDLLSGYGVRVNKSVFECMLSEADIRKIKETLQEKIQGDEDSIIYYRLCNHCRDRIERDGREPELDTETVKTV